MLGRVAKRITATEASRSFSEILDAVEHRSEEFLVERHGRPIAAVTPARGVTPTRATWADVLRLFHEGPQPDPRFARDMARILRSRPAMPKDPWGRSSTRRS
ncbi:MAG: type II toxin-antitoxin system Phd/YefM family antitoxin [Chloroflexi bacterium]|nr:MAG: type II toxin-antitoxin system Phd/YefM family antitoxin [Chloroflexota bacterium]